MQNLRACAQAQQNRNLWQARQFSTEPEAPKKEEAASVPEPTKEEVEEGRKQWGIQYDDECLKFEKEWEIIAGRVESEQRTFLASELGDLQKSKVEMLADKVMTLNLYEMRYFAMQVKEKTRQATGLNPMKLNLDWPSIKQDSTGSWPPANPNWFK